MQSPTTIYDVIKQRDHARESYRAVCTERDQLRQLCLIAAHYIRYLPLRPEDSDHEIIERLEAAARGDKDVAAKPQATPPAQAGPRGNGSDALRAPAGQAAPAAPSVQRDLQPAPAPDPGEGGGKPKDVTLTTVEKKVLKALSGDVATYDLLVPATGLARHKIISAMHTLARFELVERAEGGWRRA